MKNKFTKPLVALAALATIGAGSAAGVLASAQTADTSTAQTATQDHPKGDFKRGPGGMHGRGTAGTVTAINGSTLTVTGENGTTYTVEAASAKVSKIVDVAVSDIKVGDRIGAQGSLSGTTVTAERIMTGIPEKPADAPAQQ